MFQFCGSMPLIVFIEDKRLEFTTMASINHPSSSDMLTTTAMAALVTPDHDAGLCHDHHWARDPAAERRAYPVVANPALISTPSSATHDDAHYAN